MRAAGVPAGLIFVGTGPDEARLRREARVLLGTAAGFAGHVADAAALATAYASADVFVHVNPYEPFRIGPLEAMASGVPVVLPRAGGVLIYANDRNAWLAAAHPSAFADAILDVLSCPNQPRCTEALATARRYDWGEVAPRVFQRYDELRARGCRDDVARWEPRQATAAAGARPAD